MDIFFHVTISAVTVIQLFFWVAIFPFAKNRNDEGSDSFLGIERVAVLISAKNEEQNLKQNLPKILSQNYPAFKVYVIDDGSTDGTQNILDKYASQDSRLQVLNSPYSITGHPGKKKAITNALEKITEPILLCTDADCYPASDSWMSKMVAPLEHGKDIVLGYSPYEKEIGSFVNRFIRFDTCYSAIQYLSLANLGSPYMGVGRNMAWRRSLFEKGNGFEKHIDIASGDDDLFVNQHADRYNVATVIDPDSFMYSKPKKTWKSYIKQRKRHISSSRKYRLPHQYILTALHGSHILHYILIAMALLLNVSTLFVLFWLILRWLTVSVIFYQLARPLKCMNLRLYVPILDLLYACFYSVLTPALFMKKNATWD